MEDLFAHLKPVDFNAKIFWSQASENAFFFWDVSDIQTNPRSTKTEVASQYDELLDISMSRAPKTRLEKKMRLMLIHGRYTKLGGGTNGWEDISEKMGLSKTLSAPFKGRDWGWWYDYKELERIVDYFIENDADFSRLEDQRVKTSYTEFVTTESSDTVRPVITEELRPLVDALKERHIQRFGRFTKDTSYCAARAASIVVSHPHPFTIKELLVKKYNVKKFAPPICDNDDENIYYAVGNPLSIYEVASDMCGGYQNMEDFENSEIGIIHEQKERVYKEQTGRNYYTFHSLTKKEMDKLVKFVEMHADLEKLTFRYLFQ